MSGREGEGREGGGGEREGERERKREKGEKERERREREREGEREGGLNKERYQCVMLLPLDHSEESGAVLLFWPGLGAIVHSGKVNIDTAVGG